jgi:hypothetical protein
MRTPLILSSVLHLVIVLIALVGLPYFAQKREPLEITEVPVDVVEVGPMTIARLREPIERPRPQPVRPAPPKDLPTPPVKAVEKSEPPPPAKEPEPPKPEPPKVEPPKPEPPKVEPPKPDPIPEPPKTEPPKPEPPKPEPPKPEPPKPEPPKPEPKKPDPPKPEPKRNLADVLKNLEKPKPKSDPAPEKPAQQVAEASPPPIGAAGDRLTVSEKDALRGAIARLWNVDPGARDVQDMQVRLRVWFDSSMRIIPGRIEFVDGSRPLSDPHFRAFTESARRALDRLEVLPLPAEKYASERSIVVTFSPRDMF